MVTPPTRQRGLGPRQRFILFLPDAMAEHIRWLARRGRRPLNTQMEMILEEGLRQEDRPEADLTVVA